MEESGVVVSNKALEFLERLLRWDELCAQLRELYHKYLDLAAFRSEKCYFPGRKCRRSWNRQYDVGDLTLMWTYIANTAPLCGKLMKALAEVEYEIRLGVLKNLEKYGGKELRTGRTPTISLYRPVYARIISWDKLYVLWRDVDEDFDYNDEATNALSQRAVKKIDIDREYERLWLEVPVPQHLFGGRDVVPLVLLRNYGWLLSDDSRQRFKHIAGNLGQVAARLFDWIALAMYNGTRIPIMFRIYSYSVSKTRDEINPFVVIEPAGQTLKLMYEVYRKFGISLDEDSERVIESGYKIIKTLREGAIKREGNVYVVDDVGMWIAFSNMINTLIFSDGYVMPYELGVAAKEARVRTLAEALSGTVSGHMARLTSWHYRLLLPVSPALPFEKSIALYKTLTEYPAAALVEIGNERYLLNHSGNGKFVIGKGIGGVLAQKLGLTAKINGRVIVFSYTQLTRVNATFLNDCEKEAIREVKPVPTFNSDIEKIVEALTKNARLSLGRKRLVAKFDDRAKFEEFAAKLKSVGFRISVDRESKRIIIYERRTFEAVLNVLSRLFPSLYVYFVKAAPSEAENLLSKTAATQRLT